MQGSMGGRKKQKRRDKTKTALKLPTPNISSEADIPSRDELLRQVDYLTCEATFCFRYYDDKHKKYSAKAVPKCRDFCLLFKHLKKLGGMTWREIEAGDYHAHEVTWKSTRQREGFSSRLGDAPSTYPPYQFQVFGKFRIFGFHQGNVFHVVWFDYKHEVDS